MGFLKDVFKKKKKEKAKVVEKKVHVVQHGANEDIPEVAVLSYGNGVYKIPVDGFREGMKRFGMVKAYSPEKGFVSLKDLGNELLIFDPKYNHTIPLQDCENPEYQDIVEMIYGKANIVVTDQEPEEEE